MEKHRFSSRCHLTSVQAQRRDYLITCFQRADYKEEGVKRRKFVVEETATLVCLDDGAASAAMSHLQCNSEETLDNGCPGAL